MKLKGFTPVVDSIRDDVGGVGAMVYGAMWRFAQAHGLRVCTARQKKIAERAGCTRETVGKYQKILADKGYISNVGSSKGGVISWSCKVDITGEVYIGVGGDEDWDDDPVVTPVPQEKKELKKKDFLDYLVDNQVVSNFDSTWCPADTVAYLVPFGEWFADWFNRQPTKSEYGLWIREAREWLQRGYDADMVIKVIEHCTNAEISIKSPRSVTWAFDQLNSREEDETFSREM